MLKAIENSNNLRTEVYKRIKESIIKHYFLPGMKLDEKQISEKLEVSRTPVREAFNRLVQEGLVNIETGRGVFVSRVTAQDLIEVLYMREVLEGLAARLFTERAEEEDIRKLEKILEPYTEDNVESLLEEYNLANVEFHNFIIEGTKNSRLISTVYNLYDHLTLAKVGQFIKVTGRSVKSLKEHKKIILAITKRDSKKAEDLIKEHICSLRNDILDNLDKIKSTSLYF